jgi:hypothetical protein
VSLTNVPVRTTSPASYDDIHARVDSAAVAPGGSVTDMLSRGQVFVVNAGETVRLDCEFQADARFNLFDNPVWWRKAQRHEETQVNMMANILEPFESTRRFRVAFQSRAPDYKLSLFIAGAT